MFTDVSEPNFSVFDSISSKPFDFLIDTGSTITAVSYKTWLQISHSHNHLNSSTSLTVHSASRTPLRIHGSFPCQFQINGVSYPFPTYVIYDLSHPVILGHDFLAAYAPSIDFRTLQLQFHNSSQPPPDLPSVKSENELRLESVLLVDSPVSSSPLSRANTSELVEDLSLGSILETFEKLAVQSNPARPLFLITNHSLSPESHQQHWVLSSQALMTLIWLTAISKVKTKSNVLLTQPVLIQTQPPGGLSITLLINPLVQNHGCLALQNTSPQSLKNHDSMSVSLNQYRSHPLRTNLLPYMLFLVTFLTVFHLAGANIRLAPKYPRHQNRESLTIPSFHPKVHCSIYVDQITENVKYFNADVHQPYYRRFPINSYHSTISGKGSEYKTTIELHPEAFCYSNTFDLYYLQNHSL